MNRKIFSNAGLLALAFSILMSCASQSPQEFAERYIEAEKKAWSTGELGDLEALEDTNVVYHLPGMDLAGWKAHADYILQSRPTISDLKQNWNYLSGEGNHFALSYDSSAIVTNQGLRAAVSNNYLFVFRIENNKVVEVWTNGSATTTPIDEGGK